MGWGSCALVTCDGGLRSAARLLIEQLQLPGERDTGAAAMLKKHLAALLGRLFAGPVCPAARNMDPRSASKNDPSIA
jgi:hypothetical protein